MLPVKNFSAIDLVIQELQSNAYGPIICLVSHEKKILVDHLQRHYPEIKILYQRQALGLAHAIWWCQKELIKNKYFGVVLPDNLIRPVDKEFMNDLAKQMLKTNSCASIGIKEVSPERIQNYGMVTISKENEIKSLIEKPKVWTYEPLGIIGRYVFQSETIFNALNKTLFSEAREISITETLNDLAKEGLKITSLKPNSEFFDIGTPELWLETNNKLFKEL